VPWPKRPPTEVTLAPGIEAAELDPVLWPAELNGTRPVGVRIASILGANPFEEFYQQDGAYIFAPTSGSANFNRHDPNAHVLAPIGNKTTQVLGVVMYRQQVANTLFPMVAGDTLQVSPLVKKIAWAATTYAGRTGALLADPFFAIQTAGSPIPTPHLWLLDTQGVVEGARYHYYLVCFGKDGEITQTIDAGFYGPN
jgi:hypothetical protein